MAIDTGRGNPGVKALEYHSNNIGRLEDVLLRSSDGSGVLGLDLTHHDVGPALVKRVRVAGFRTEGYGHGKALAHRVLASRQPDAWQDVEVASPDVDECFGSHAVTGFGAPRGALKLPVEETPEPPLPPVSEWVSVTRFRDRKAGDDWSLRSCAFGSPSVLGRRPYSHRPKQGGEYGLRPNNG